MDEASSHESADGPDVLVELSGLRLFDGVGSDSLGPLVGLVDVAVVESGEAIVRQDEAATHFFLVLEGHADVTVGDGTRLVGRAGPESLIGELGLLRRQQRNATVTATTPMRLLRGGPDALGALLEIDAVRQTLARQAAHHLAGSINPVEVDLPDGSTVWFRPVLPDDATSLTEALREMSPANRRMRFFSSAPLPPAVVRYLTDLDYRNHFAWAVTPPDVLRGQEMATGRMVRLPDAETVAEVALTVFDAYHRRGIGRVLLGAIAVAGIAAGIERFEAEILRDNQPSIKLFASLGAETIGGDDASIRVAITPDQLASPLPPTKVAALTVLAHDVLALSRMPIAG
jgi:CRP-like cAMP-binding protein